ncbi:hypothetical protein ACFYY8_16865 [Streptosporangium sp. NPDC001559]|uniref:hypothetical protein n=1 Tax=Streptosporangium sp. NPDC001559 TaxID=3366187 RepID=UPI0036EF5386
MPSAETVASRSCGRYQAGVGRVDDQHGEQVGDLGDGVGVGAAAEVVGPDAVHDGVADERRLVGGVRRVVGEPADVRRPGAGPYRRDIVSA